MSEFITEEALCLALGQVEEVKQESPLTAQ
jgi:hypothetical protein